MGNWEFSYLIAITCLQNKYGQFCVIRRSLKLKWLEKFIIKNCEECGLVTINKRGARKNAVKALNEG